MRRSFLLFMVCSALLNACGERDDSGEIPEHSLTEEILIIQSNGAPVEMVLLGYCSSPMQGQRSRLELGIYQDPSEAQEVDLKIQNVKYSMQGILSYSPSPTEIYEVRNLEYRRDNQATFALFYTKDSSTGAENLPVEIGAPGTKALEIWGYQPGRTDELAGQAYIPGVWNNQELLRCKITN